MSKYYYLVAGLPELTLEDSKLSYTVADFKTEIYPGLSSSDQKLIDLFYLKFDNANVLKLLKDKDAVIDLRGNFSAAAKILQLSGGYVDVYSGNDDQVVPMLALGGKGVISVLSNVAPKQTHDMCAEFFKGNIEASRRIQLKAMPLIEALFSEVNPIPVKAAMNMLGWEVGPLRMPLSEMEEEHQKELKAAMDAFGVKAKGEN